MARATKRWPRVQESAPSTVAVSATVVSIAVWLLAGCGSDADDCRAEDLSARLEAARSGDVVRAPDCRIVGNFVVPAGVTLVGTERSTIASEAGTAVRLAPAPDGSASPTTVRGLRVESAGLVGIAATGTGVASVEDTSVHATAGIGLAATLGVTLTVRDCSVTGPVTVETASDPVFASVATARPEHVPAGPTRECVPGAGREVGCPGGQCTTIHQYCDEFGLWVSVTATVGVALVDLPSADLQGLTVSGFTRFGVVFDHVGLVTWRGGGASVNLQVGLHSAASNVTLTDVTLTDTLPRIVGAGAVFVSADESGPAAVLETTRLVCSDNSDYGIVQLGVQGAHSGLTARSNGNAAVWIQGATGFRVDGATIEDNARAGVVVVDSSDVRLSGLTIARTSLVRAVDREIGDGVQFLQARGVELTESAVLDNSGVGIFVEGPATAVPVSFTNVRVQRAAGVAGALVGERIDAEGRVASASGLYAPGLSRDSDTDLADAAFGGPVDLLAQVGGFAPSDLPSPTTIVGGFAPSD